MKVEKELETQKPFEEYRKVQNSIGLTAIHPKPEVERYVELTVDLKSHFSEYWLSHSVVRDANVRSAVRAM